jgi:hypothetical protein
MNSSPAVLEAFRKGIGQPQWLPAPDKKERDHASAE